MKDQNHIQLLRHATLIIQIGRKKILVDPMLSSKSEMDPVQNCGNDIRIPMVDLPVNNEELKEVLAGMDAVFVTHTHRDHWDVAAQKLISKDKEIFCQPADADKIKGQGFLNVRPIEDQVNWEGITISRTTGRHGTGDIGQKMGEVSGFVFQHKKTALYVAGDTIWCAEVEKALNKYKPDVTVLNAGGARFLTGGPITMTPDDVKQVHGHLPRTKIIAVHMDTINHCLARRSDLKTFVMENNLVASVAIPLDGEIVNI